MIAGMFFTPHHIGDPRRMVWLRPSIEVFHGTRVRHVVAVPKQMRAAFRNALGRTPANKLTCAFSPTSASPCLHTRTCCK